MMELIHFIYNGETSDKFKDLDLYDILEAANQYQVTYIAYIHT